MSFDNQETSAEGGAPIELYKIEGAGTFYYTSGNTPFTYEEDEYIPIAMSRSGPSISSKTSAGSLTIKMPFDNPFAIRYLAGVPPAPDRVTIYQTHLSDSSAEVQVFWSGVVSGVKFANEEASVLLSGVLARTATQVPSSTFSWACNHVLYGARCGVIESAHQFPLTVTSVSADGVKLGLEDSDATVNPQASLAADDTYFNGGRVENGEEGSQRMVITLTSPSAGVYIATLMVPTDLEVGESITLSAGCDRSLQTCYARFSNSERYGGFPFIPTLNPFATDVKREE